MRAFLGCRRCNRVRFLKSVDLFEQEKNGERNNQKINNIVKKDAVVEGWSACRLGRRHAGIILPRQVDKQIRKIRAPEGQYDGRHQYVLDKGSNYFSKRGADDNGNGQ